MTGASREGVLPLGINFREAWHPGRESKELERQYTPSRWVVRLGAEEALRTYSQTGNEATKKARATRRSLLDVRYGDGEAEKLDIYFPEKVSEVKTRRPSW